MLTASDNVLDEANGFGAEILDFDILKIAVSLVFSANLLGLTLFSHRIPHNNGHSPWHKNQDFFLAVL